LIPQVIPIAEKLLSGPLRAEVLQLLIGRWGEEDPVAALAGAEALPTIMKRDAISAVLEVWSRMDLNAMMTWAEQLPPGPFRNEAWQQLVGTVAVEDPQRALELSKKLPSGTFRDNSLFPIFSTWAQTDPAGAATRAL